MDRLHVDARRVQSPAEREREEAARDRSELVRGDLRHARGWIGPEAADPRPRLRRRAVLHARRQADRLATFRRSGTHRRRLDDESRRHEPAPDHRLRIDELGALHAPVRAVHHLRVQQARVRELRAVHGRHRGQEGAGARHLLGRLRRPAGPLARRQTARVDVDAIGRRPGTDFPGAVESRESARGAQERAAKKAEQEVMRTPRTQPQTSQNTLKILICCVSALSAVSAVAFGQDTHAYVHTLASERLEGRLAGSNGEKLAADFLVSELQKIGAKPLPGQTDFREPFDFTAGTKDGGSSVGLTPGTTYTGTDVRALSFSDNGDVEGPVVFAGYGIVVPDSQGFPYDSYATLDVKDKVVVVLRYFPEDADQKTKGILARYADLRYKAMAARQHGAKAMIVVTGPRSPNAGELAPMTFDTALAGSGIVAVTANGVVANQLFASTEIGRAS